jgi:hypothetical protein
VLSWQAGLGPVWLGMAGHGRAGRAWLGTARHGMAWQAWQAWRGRAWHGTAGRGGARQGRHGVAGRGVAGGMAGTARQAGQGLARPGGAGRAGRHGLFLFKKVGVMKIQSVNWRNGAQSKGIDPVKAFNALERVREKNDGLTDDAIVSAAKAKNHILHGWFEWDDSVAANEHRRAQARTLIRSFEVVYVEAPELTARAYEVETKSGKPQETRTVYTTTAEVLSNPESRDRLISDAIRMAMEFRRRFKMLHELDRVIEEIDKAIESIGYESVK